VSGIELPSDFTRSGCLPALGFEPRSLSPARGSAATPAHGTDRAELQSLERDVLDHWAIAMLADDTQEVDQLVAVAHAIRSVLHRDPMVTDDGGGS